VPASTRGLLRERHAQKEPHSSIQVSPITRPSLRSGWTAYAVISREPTIPLASLAPRIDDAVRPVGLAHISARAWPWQRRSGPHGFAVRTARHVAAVFPNSVDRAGNLQRDEA